jgi:hypothetical protein
MELAATQRTGSRRVSRPLPALATSDPITPFPERGQGDKGASRRDRQVCRLPHGCVIHVQIAAYGAHDDHAGVQTDAQFDYRPVSAAHLLCVRLYRLLHPQGGIARAHGVILVSKRRAEECHDSVTYHLVHRALVPVDDFHHPFKHGIE